MGEQEIISLKKMIEQAKKENDEVLVEYLTQALNHLLEKQKKSEDIKLKSQENINQEENKTTEEKQEIAIENKKDEEEKTDEIENSIAKGISKLTKFKSGNIRLESPYMDVKVQSNNQMLKNDLESLLMTIALDEIKGEHNFADKFFEILQKAKTEEDFNDLLKYLQSIATVGELGALYNEVLSQSVNKLLQKKKNQEEPNINITAKQDEIYKKIDILDMRLDGIKSGKVIDPDDLYDLAKAYEKRIKDLELLYTASNDKSKKDEIRIKVDQLEKKVSDIRAYASQIEELANYSFNF